MISKISLLPTVNNSLKIYCNLHNQLVLFSGAIRTHLMVMTRSFVNAILAREGMATRNSRKTLQTLIAFHCYLIRVLLNKMRKFRNPLKGDREADQKERRTRTQRYLYTVYIYLFVSMLCCGLPFL